MQNKNIRRCIYCGADDAETLFTYTRHFMTSVKMYPEQLLDSIGWDPNVSSSIVKCRKCSAKYVRDVFPAFECGQQEYDEDEVKDLWKRGNTQNMMVNNATIAGILYRLMKLVSKSFGKNGDLSQIKILDYGAGVGRWCNIARALGFLNVYAYEPFNAYHPKFMDKFNFPGITASREWGDISQHGPFHAVICNGAFEHFQDPKVDIKLIHASLCSGGYLYISNPFMNLDKELTSLRKALRIVKKDKISHYHPGHVNYLTPELFKNYLRNNGFNVLNRHPLPVNFKSLVKEILISFRLHPRASFFTQKNS